MAGDSGAGYLNPGFLSVPRPHSGLPSGWTAWEKHCQQLHRQWDISLTGFVIDGYARGLDKEGLDAYARFSPDGIVAQKIGRQGMHRDMPYLRMATDLYGPPSDAARNISLLTSGLTPRFIVCRSILQSPGWYAQVEEELKKLRGESIQVVDLYTLMWLVREYESHWDAYANSAYARAKEVVAIPDASAGLAPLHVPDGPVAQTVHQGVRCWQVAQAGTGRYLYLDVDDAFYHFGKGALQVQCEYFDRGAGQIVLEYDSTDATALLGGAYKASPTIVERGNRNVWQAATFEVPDARLAGSQNGGADFRFFVGGDELLVRSVRVIRR